MTITSPAFEDTTVIPTKYTCYGPNNNPPLDFHDIPENAASLVLIFEDRDAKPKPWIHWLLFNIPPSLTHIDEDSVPLGATEGFANGGTPGYEGPCPKYFKGTHHYVFMLYALDVTLDVPQSSTVADIAPLTLEHTLAKAELTGLREGTQE